MNECLVETCIPLSCIVYYCNVAIKHVMSSYHGAITHAHHLIIGEGNSQIGEYKQNILYTTARGPIIIITAAMLLGRPTWVNKIKILLSKQITKILLK